MKKKTVFRLVLIVLCVLCTLSVLQVRNVLANHRQNERDDSTDDSFNEDSPHDLVLPPPPEFEPFEPIPLIPTIPRTPGLPSDTYRHTLLYKYEPYYIMEGWNYTEMYTPESKSNKNYLKEAITSDI